jgi:hypothetical protein
MEKGPKVNVSDQFNDIFGQDQLGIKNVAVNILDEILNGITTVTPRARYWSFYTWVLYDFIYNSGLEKTEKNLKLYIKRQEWYFILANIGYKYKNKKSLSYLQGVTVAEKVWLDNDNNLFDFNSSYIKNAYGGYSIYRNVIKNLKLTTDSGEDKDIQIDRLTNLGKEVALAFEHEISNTEYYRNYRLKEREVPKDVLIDYGNKVHIDNLKSTEDGKMLLELFINKKTNNIYEMRRAKSLEYFIYIIKNENEKDISNSKWRHFFYKKYSNLHNNIPEEFKDISISWEILASRVYFTYGLEGIWSKILLLMQYDALTINQILSKAFNEIKVEYLNKKIGSLLDNNLIEVKEIEEIEYNLINSNENSLISGLQLMLDVYKKMNNRDDFNDFHYKLLSLGGREDISIKYWIRKVEEYKDKTIQELLIFIIENFIIDQHYKTAFEKMYTTNNKTFHFNLEENELHWLKNDRPTFNGIRVIQGKTILEDLGLI